MSRPKPLIVEVKKGESAPFDGVILDNWATAELYAHRDLCLEIKGLIRQNSPYEFYGGMGIGAFIVLLGAIIFCKRSRNRLSI